MKRYVLMAMAGILAAGLAVAQTATAPKAKLGLKGIVRQRVIKALGLTSAQKAQAKTIFQEAKQTGQPVRQLLKQNREAMTAAVKANNTQQIQQLAVAQGNLQGQLVANRATAKAKLYAVLTPDQQAKLDTMAQTLKNALAQRAAKNLAP